MPVEQSLNKSYGSENSNIDNVSKFEGVCLNIQNLDQVIDEKRLCKEFAKYGTVLSVKVHPQEKSKLRSGVVNFLSPADALQATQALNGGVIEANVIYVTLASSQNRRRSSSARRPSMPMPIYQMAGRSSSTDLSSLGSSTSSASSLGTSPGIGTSPGASLLYFKSLLCRTTSY